MTGCWPFFRVVSTARSHRWPWRHQLIAGAVWAAALACQRPNPALQPEACISDRYLVVNNQVGTDIDVYHIKGAGTPRLVGSARPGQSEFPLPSLDGSEGFQGRYPGGQWIAPAFGNQDVAKRLTFTVKCR